MSKDSEEVCPESTLLATHYSMFKSLDELLVKLEALLEESKMLRKRANNGECWWPTENKEIEHTKEEKEE